MQLPCSQLKLVVSVQHPQAQGGHLVTTSCNLLQNVGGKNLLLVASLKKVNTSNENISYQLTCTFFVGNPINSAKWCRHGVK